MNTTVNISFQEDLLKQIDEVAKKESRSRSELLREAARMYVDRKKKWQQIFSISDAHVKKNKLKEEDVAKEIANYRKSNRKNN